MIQDSPKPSDFFCAEAKILDCSQIRRLGSFGAPRCSSRRSVKDKAMDGPPGFSPFWYFFLKSTSEKTDLRRYYFQEAEKYVREN